LNQNIRWKYNNWIIISLAWWNSRYDYIVLSAMITSYYLYVTINNSIKKMEVL
jgi:hypothetical protein